MINPSKEDENIPQIDTCSTIKERLLAVRKAQQPKMSQTVFGAAIGMSYSAYKNYEYGITFPTDAMLKLIAFTFHVSYDWLKTGAGSMYQPITGLNKVFGLDDDSRLYERMKAVRKSQYPKMTQAAFASTLGLTAKVYQHYECGETMVPRSVLNILTHTYQINLNWLLTGKEDTQLPADSVDTYASEKSAAPAAPDVRMEDGCYQWRLISALIKVGDAHPELWDLLEQVSRCMKSIPSDNR